MPLYVRVAFLVVALACGCEGCEHANAMEDAVTLTFPGTSLEEQSVGIGEHVQRYSARSADLSPTADWTPILSCPAGSVSTGWRAGDFKHDGAWCVQHMRESLQRLDSAASATTTRYNTCCYDPTPSSEVQELRAALVTTDGDLIIVEQW